MTPKMRFFAHIEAAARRCRLPTTREPLHGRPLVGEPGTVKDIADALQESHPAIGAWATYMSFLIECRDTAVTG